ncbi:MAG: hypothetical protein KC458_10755 [Dehalococcoidia bacterium]|nr:hypothetical protein [Dehalococcoidia bacterium]MCB9491512.1 hypothetical protein [Dehalococcoidia bacterium]
MASEDLGEKLRELTGRQYTHAEVAELLGAYHAPETAETMQGEYEVMPTLLPYLLVESWRLANESGKTWEFTSLQPDRPIEFARNRKVRFVVDVDENGVSFGVAHVHGYKADWYQPEGQPAAAEG